MAARDKAQATKNNADEHAATACRQTQADVELRLRSGFRSSLERVATRQRCQRGCAPAKRAPGIASRGRFGAYPSEYPMTQVATPAAMPYTHSVALLERRVLVFIEYSFLARLMLCG
jgi:hypothetical protein